MGHSQDTGWAAAYWGCAMAHAVGHVLNVPVLRVVSKSALMPTLAAWSRRRGCPRLLVAALLASATGDTLMEQGLLYPGMATYAAAHACYVTLFARGLERTRWQVLAAYTGAGSAIVAVLWPRLGPLRRPVAAYSVMLTATAVTSGWYDRRTGSGGALFVISDALIGTRLAGHDFPSRAPLVGLTYTIGQYQLASGVVAHHGQQRIQVAAKGNGAACLKQS
ncbi:lysoplasmalogenase [Kribbella capetownensis]|uniref:Lysoplasmalogenase n=2 Tax=Kribbella capetownensis TaxID=1572659 RepID=A0A4R0IU56_9ACTN|nr:lysoplasmalogenase [Kribbella capetownensis]